MPQKKDKKRKDKGNARSEPVGHFHPLTQVINDAVSIFAEMGFVVASGPEVETEYYNFDALNIPANHPARDMWDTFWLKPKNAGYLLRTHTSPVQILNVLLLAHPFRHIILHALYSLEFFAHISF